MQTSNDYRLSVMGMTVPSTLEDFLATTIKNLDQTFNDQTNEWEFESGGLYEWWLSTLTSFILPHGKNYEINVSKSVPFDWRASFSGLYAEAVENDQFDSSIELHPSEFDALVLLTERVVSNIWEAWRNGLITLSGDHFIKDVSITQHGDFLITIGQRTQHVTPTYHSSFTTATPSPTKPKYNLA